MKQLLCGLNQWKKGCCYIAAVLFVFTGFPSPARGEGIEPETSDLTYSNLDLWKQFATVILVLILIIGLILLLVKIVARKDLPWMKNRVIQSLGGIPLGQNKSLQVIDFGEVIYLIGVGENVQCIDKIDRKQDVEAIRARFEARGASNAYSTFQELLNNKLRPEINREQKLDELFSERSGRLKDE